MELRRGALKSFGFVSEFNRNLKDFVVRPGQPILELRPGGLQSFGLTLKEKEKEKEKEAVVVLAWEVAQFLTRRGAACAGVKIAIAARAALVVYLLDGAGIGHPAEKRVLPGPQQDSGGNRVTSAATGVSWGPVWECKIWDQRVQNMGPKSAKYGTRECKIWDQTFSLKRGWYTFSGLGVQNMGPKSAKYGTKECKIWDQRVQNMGLTAPT